MVQGKTKFVRVSEGFELSEFELSGVNYYKKHCQIQGELDLVRVSEEFELSEFELAGDYCNFQQMTSKKLNIYFKENVALRPLNLALYHVY